MARPPMPIGTHGNIKKTQRGPGRWEAFARYRDYDGETRKIKKYGATGAAAERALKEAIRDRAKLSGGNVAEITRDTTLAELAELWLEKRNVDKLATATMASYRERVRDQIVPGVGKVRVGEATVGVLDRFSRSIPGDTTAKQTRGVLNGMMRLAAQHDAIDHNPVSEITKRRPAAKVVLALSVEDFHRYRARAAAWAGANRYGKPRGPEIPDFVDVMAGAGTRIGEGLALLRSEIVWDEVLVDEETGAEKYVPGRITVSGTIVGNERQPFPKTDASWREITMPRFAMDALRRVLARDLATDQDLVFPGRHGGPKTTANTRRQMREARSHVEHEPVVDGVEPDPHEFDWVTPHVLRKTAATLIEETFDADHAAKVLGHTSPDITRRHYIRRAAVAPDVSAALDRLGERPA